MIDPWVGEEEWNHLVVAGVSSPGVVRLSGDGVKVEWDVKKAEGQKGGSNTRKGLPQREFDAEFTLANDPTLGNDFEAWDAFQALLLTSVTGAEPIALTVYHPDLARCGINAVELGSIGLLQLDGKGGGKIKVHFLEYAPPAKKAAAGAKGAKSSKPDPNDPVSKATADLNAALEEGKNL